MYFIYILYSSSADKYYVGYTAIIEIRLRQHNEQDYFNTYTSKFRPWTLKALFSCGADEKDAIKLKRSLQSSISYSDFKLFTGFKSAAVIAW